MVCRKWAIAIATTSVMAVSGLPAAEVTCDYDSNAEWAWAEDKICQTRPVPPVAVPPPGAFLLNDEAPETSRDWPVCESEASDSDGDGWGWEKGESCRIQLTARYPNCSSSAIDNDADGWGWEDGQSCVIADRKKSTYPDCEYRMSDRDGDGWGYEGTESCEVTALSKYPLCTARLVDFDDDGWGYEEGFSCTHVQQKEVQDGDESGPDPVRSAVLFEQGFDQSTPGQYIGKDLNEQWNTPLWHLGFEQGRATIVEEQGRGNSLRITYPGGEFGAAGASAFLSDLEFAVDLPGSFEELYVSYDVKFAEGFEFVRGGKLPGLCGYDNTRTPASGCNTGGGFPDGFDGWSARGMWREGGKMENYVYHSSQQNYYGDDEYWGLEAQPGEWHQIQHRVVLNTVGEANGVLEAWFDGRKVLSETDFVYRKSPEIGINLFYFSTFYGGNDPSWAPETDQYVFFDNFRIATTPLPETLAMAAALNDDVARSGSTVSSGGGGVISLSLILLGAFRRGRFPAN